MEWKKATTICALVAALAGGACSTTPPSYNYARDRSAQGKVLEGKYTFMLEQYALKPGNEFKVSELGKKIGTQKGQFTLNDGTIENATIEMYDYDNDGYPDAIVFRRQNGAIASLGIDQTSNNYEKIKQKLQNIATLYVSPQKSP